MIQTAVQIALVMLIGSLALSFYRLAKGPTTPDRIIAADNIATNLTGVLALFAIQTGEKTIIIAVVALTILSFVATAVYAKFLERGKIVE
ncbi:MAG: monovalent cation/H+ antiporter complex subunit F [bacterium]